MDPGSDRARRGLFPACIVVLALCAPGAGAQTADRAIEFDDLGLTTFIEVSPRGAGLGGFAASAADATALVYNPAGLARIKRITGSLVAGVRGTDVTTGYDGSSQTYAGGPAGLQFAGGAVPLAVVRGSFVPAAAVYRAFVSDLDIGYRGYNAANDRDDSYLLQQSGSTFAFTLGAGVDLSSAFSAGFSLVVLEGGFEALRQFDYRDRDPTNTVHTYVVDDLNGDVSGIGGRIGLEFYAHEHAQIGIAFTTPTVLNVDVAQTHEVTLQIDNDIGVFERTTTSTSTRYQTPYRVDGALAVPWGAWLLVAQAGVANWDDATIDRHRLVLSDVQTPLRRVVEWRAGVEWTSSRLPLRLRAGAARLPFATNYLQADRIDNDSLERQTDTSNPLCITAGAGVLLRAAITVDASYSHASGARSSARISDERTWSQFLLQGSYWF